MFNPFKVWRKLSEHGILGMNRRNGDYILQYNPRSFYPFVDDKRKTKELATANGISVPKLYGVIEIEHQISELPDLVGPFSDFVIKPAHGSGGEGIVVIVGRVKNRFRKSSGFIVGDEELKHHLSNILSGMYSLAGLPDVALIERRVNFDPVFSNISYQGVPDIRTVVFRGIPVMAMIRLPTRSSDGKANLHQGAVGVGIDMNSGKMLRGVYKDQIIDEHPDTGAEFYGLEIPGWNEILELTARCHDIVNLGYIGVDIVLDRDLGPQMLEINARPGLSIQLANKGGLINRLTAIENLATIPDDIRSRIDIAKNITEEEKSSQ